MTKTKMKVEVPAVSNERWDDDRFARMRQDVLAQWDTGREADDLAANLDYLSALPKSQIWPIALAEYKSRGEMMIVPQIGYATVEQMVESLQRLGENGAAGAFIQADPYTRKLRLQEAAKAIDLSYETGKSQLTGYPWINFGVRRSRKMIEAIRMPLHVNGNNDEDPRLLAEVSLAAGATNNLMFDLRDLLTHEKDYPLAQRIINNQYICRLASWYTEHGVPIELTAGGMAMACVGSTPGLGIAVAILESLTAAAQGAKHFSLLLDPQGNLQQDLAAGEVLERLVRHYFDEFGYRDITLSRTVYPFTGEWPASPVAATVLMGWFTMIAAWSGAAWLYTKTPKEAIGTPSTESNIDSIQICRYALQVAKAQPYPRTDSFKLECEMIEAEARAVVDKALEVGDGDSALGRLRAVEYGSIDVAFPSWEYTKRKVMIGRDSTNAVRWSDPGLLPLPSNVIEYHKAKISERASAEGKDVLELAIDGVRALGRLPCSAR